MNPFGEICDMFTGIIETTGFIKNMAASGGNKSFWIESSISRELRVDQSVSHSGICLTVEEVNDNSHKVTAIEETGLKTNVNERFHNHISQRVKEGRAGLQQPVLVEELP